MVEAGAAAAARPRVSFWEAISAAHGSVFGEFRQFARLAAVPFGLSLGFSVLKIPAGLVVPGSDFIFIVLDLLPFAILGVAMNRVLLGGESPGFLPRPLFGRRTLSYLGYALLMLVILVLPLAVVAAVAQGLLFAVESSSPGASPSGRTFLLGIVLFLLLLYVIARLSLVFPARSLDQRLGLAGSWRLSRGSGLKLFGVLLAALFFMALAAIVGSLILGSNININIGGSVELPPAVGIADAVLASLPSQTWSTLVAYAGCGLIIGAYASAYRQLTGWGGPRQDILERFE